MFDSDPQNTVTAAQLVAIITRFRDGLRTNQGALNRLNVYPVPDGDTGTNMALTVESVVGELQAKARSEGAAPGELSMVAACQAISHGSLMGARGNSGVILSQILRGITAHAKQVAALGPADVAHALTEASTAAYAAVMRPIEGTILTVVRGAAVGATVACGPGSTVVDVLSGARDAGAQALASTPDLLPVLKAAGVVDAGGAGFLLLLDAALNVLDGRPVPTVDAPGTDMPSMPADPDVSAASGGTSGNAGNVADLRYEVMYLLDAEDARVPGFKEAWAAIGDSIVVVGGDGLWNCHIHTDDIGASIEAAIDIGRPRSIRVTDLLDQVHEVVEERWVREATVSPSEESPHAREPVCTAIVAVCGGDGLRRLFWSLGVQQVVAGGQSMNPSTAQLLDAVEACPAQSVVVLPNNKNIIAVAQQVQALTAKTVTVIGTRGVTEGLAAAMQYDPRGDAGANAEAMRAAADSVVSGEITRAVRDSTTDGPGFTVPIVDGDWLGIARDGGIVVVDSALPAACTALLAKLVEDRHEILTIIEGDGSSPAITRLVTEWVRDHHPGVTTEVHHGGQPLYPYLFGVE